MEAFVRGNKIIFGMVGLPARGKTYIANKIVCYLKWLGFKARFFNIGKYRRENCGTTGCTSDFFDPDNSPAFEARQKSAVLALADLTQFLRDGGDIAVYDGTNTTADRRKMVQTYLSREFGSQHTLVWIESICTDEKIIDHNILTAKLSSPDYLDIDPQIAVQDFKNRIEQYKKIYQEVSTELDGEDVSFIKLYNVKNKIVINQINGYIESKLVSFLMNLHLTPRCIYFVRHAESMFNLENRVGGDADLSERGYAYLPKLNDFFQEEARQDRVSQKSKILTSTLRRAILTAKAIDIGAPPVSLKMLDELDAGICDSLDYKEVEEKFPEEWKARLSDKLKYRYPMGESYLDLILRVEPIIFAIERSQDPVIVVSHQAVIRCLYGYFTQVPVAEVPYLEIPLSSVIQLTPGAYKNIEQRHNLNLEEAKDKVQPKASFCLLKTCL